MVIIFTIFHLLKNDKKHQLEGKLQDIRCRLATQRQEIESTNKSRELRIAEITHLQQQLQVRKWPLGRAASTTRLACTRLRAVTEKQTRSLNQQAVKQTHSAHVSWALCAGPGTPWARRSSSGQQRGEPRLHGAHLLRAGQTDTSK